MKVTAPDGHRLLQGCFVSEIQSSYRESISTCLGPILSGVGDSATEAKTPSTEGARRLVITSIRALAC